MTNVQLESQSVVKMVDLLVTWSASIYDENTKKYRNF